MHVQEHVLGNRAQQHAQTSPSFAAHDQQLCVSCSSYQCLTGATGGIQDFLHDDGRELVVDPLDSRAQDMPALSRPNLGTC